MSSVGMSARSYIENNGKDIRRQALQKRAEKKKEKKRAEESVVEKCSSCSLKDTKMFHG